VTPWVKRLIAANVVVFFLQNTVAGLTGTLAFVPAYVLVRPWTVITYMFVHAGITHILFNMIALYFFGPRVEERLGSTRFLILYGLSGIAGAILSFIFAPYAAIVGASGAIFGVLVAFARYWPRERIYIWGVLPIEARLLILLAVIWTLWSGFRGSQGGVADFAHLGGIVAGWLFIMWVDRQHGARKFRTKVTPKIGRDVLANWRGVNPAAVHAVNRDEVNRILDKISATGLASLTPQERLFLSNFVPPDDRTVS
jgi:membrane associated rhomboid family serine protease